MPSVKIPSGKNCRNWEKDNEEMTCPFLSWTGHDEKNYCGLYRRYTDNETSYPYERKPDFCQAREVIIVEKKPKKAPTGMHNPLCDIDPTTMSWRVDVPAGSTVNICTDCRQQVYEGEFNKKSKMVLVHDQWVKAEAVE